MIRRSGLCRVLFSDLGALLADPASLPAEFRIFRAGANPSTKGTVIFDAEAAGLVMAEYARQGVDCMIDLEHHALDVAVRPDSADARGWFKLEVRNGELWAVDVKWTPDGVRRLSEKTQRYISPAFYTNEAGQVVELINVALVAMPATHQAAPLVAAKRGCAPPRVSHNGVSSPQALSKSMTPEQVKKIMAALEANDAEALAAICKELLAAAAGGGAPAADAASGDALSDTAADDAPKPDEQLAALAKQVEALTRGQTEQISKLSATVAALTSERDAIEQTERLALVADLVKLSGGVETPATVFEGDPEKLKIRKRLQDEPIAELRARVEVLRKRGPVPAHTPPAGEGDTEIKLSKAEQAYCTKHGLTAEQFAAKKAGSAKLHKATK